MIQKQIEQLVTNGRGFYKSTNQDEFRNVFGEKASLDMGLFSMEVQRHSPSADGQYRIEFKKSTKYRLHAAIHGFVDRVTAHQEKEKLWAKQYEKTLRRMN
ncbi:MAG: hypothetical protein Q8L34_02235 [Candidatus Woesearchaeota archaeon]|nr:hypothetical protein [Candidatus Woesearchaeota archaeon]